MNETKENFLNDLYELLNRYDLDVFFEYYNGVPALDVWPKTLGGNPEAFFKVTNSDLMETV